MAIVTGNPVLQGFSGTLGRDLVFRKCGNKTVVAVKSTRPRQTNSPLQQRNCNRFKEASQYARTVLRDPDKHNHYRHLALKLGKHSAYNLIISEYMREARIVLKDNTSHIRKDSKRAVFSIRQSGIPVKTVTCHVVSKNRERICAGQAMQIRMRDWIYAIPTNLDVGNVVHIDIRDTLDRQTGAMFPVR